MKNVQFNNASEHIEKLQFPSQDLQLTIWKADLSNFKGVIAAIHGLTSHGARAFHYFGLFMASKGWTTIAIDMPGFGHWEPPSRKAEKEHWYMGYQAISTLLRKCKEYSGNKKLILLGSSLGGFSCIDYVLNFEKSDDPPIDAIVALVPFLDIHLPIYLYAYVLFLILFNPKARINLGGFEGKNNCHDPNSIIFDNDPYELKNSSLGFLIEVYKSLKNFKKSLMDWPKNLPTLLISAGLDKIVNSDHVKKFYDNLPVKNKVKHSHYEKSSHYIMYENIREEVFGNVNEFLNEIPVKEEID